MPTIDIKDWNNKKVGSVDLPEEIFAYPYKEHLIHEAVRNYLASLRQGTHKIKNRSEVSGSGKKPFRQKGTGRARQGGSRPPIHRHGGTVFGPQPRDYSLQDEREGEEERAQVGALPARQGREARSHQRPGGGRGRRRKALAEKVGEDRRRREGASRRLDGEHELRAGLAQQPEAARSSMRCASTSTTSSTAATSFSARPRCSG